MAVACFNTFWISLGLLLGHFGFFWFTLDQCRSPFWYFWLDLACFDSFSVVFAHFGSFWVCLSLLLGLLVLFWVVLAYINLFWDSLGLPLDIADLFWIYLGLLLGYFVSLLVSSGLFLHRLGLLLVSLCPPLYLGLGIQNNLKRAKVTQYKPKPLKASQRYLKGDLNWLKMTRNKPKRH